MTGDVAGVTYLYSIDRNPYSDTFFMIVNETSPYPVYEYTFSAGTWTYVRKSASVAAYPYGGVSTHLNSYADIGREGQYALAMYTTSPYLYVIEDGTFVPGDNGLTTAKVTTDAKTLEATADSVYVLADYAIDAGSAVTFKASLDGGTTFETVTEGVYTTLAHTGTSLIVEVTMTRTATTVLGDELFWFVGYAG